MYPGSAPRPDKPNCKDCVVHSLHSYGHASVKTKPRTGPLRLLALAWPAFCLTHPFKEPDMKPEIRCCLGFFPKILCDKHAHCSDRLKRTRHANKSTRSHRF